MSRSRPSFWRRVLLMPANLFALTAGGAASLWLQEWTPFLAAGGASITYLVLLSTVPSFRRAVTETHADFDSEIATPEEVEQIIAELAPSQKEHYRELSQLRDRIKDAYLAVPGGRVMVASSERKLEALLTSFLRLLSTLNTYRKFLGHADRQRLEEEIAMLERELAHDSNERLLEVKRRRIEILKKRVAHFVQAQENREVVSHHLASIEDLMRLTHEQALSIRTPELMTRQLAVLEAEVVATEETVREMETFMAFVEDPRDSEDDTQRRKEAIR